MSIFEFSYTKLPLDIWFSFTDTVGGKDTDLYYRTWCAFVSLCIFGQSDYAFRLQLERKWYHLLMDSVYRRMDVLQYCFKALTPS